MDLAFSDPA
jgi:hypothetical protein